MKKFTKKTTAAAIAAAVGAALLLGGAGTLAYWTDTETSTAQTISSGSLDLGSIDAASQNWQIQHIASGKQTTKVAFTGSVVPGDVLTTTVNVPVTLSGQNIKATLAVGTPTVTGDAALSSALSVVVVSVDGTAGATKTFTGAKTGTVPVVISVTFPWGTAGQYNDTTELKSVQFSAAYTLTQEPAGV